MSSSSGETWLLQDGILYITIKQISSSGFDEILLSRRFSDTSPRCVRVAVNLFVCVTAFRDQMHRKLYREG
ncbi:hypothetical protein V6N12_009886 [Hibiscus sabdariffa]|uniref:Uncharacterized protein n=1 Tax=Hibiscus sabdariffa TaxID=183260 RepID=A0ABR2EC20_9ROSI